MLLVNSTDSGVCAGLHAGVICNLARGPFIVQGEGNNTVVTDTGRTNMKYFLMEAESWIGLEDVVAFRVVAAAGCLERWLDQNPQHWQEVQGWWDEVNHWLKHNMPHLRRANLWYVANDVLCNPAICAPVDLMCKCVTACVCTGICCGLQQWECEEAG